MTMPAERTRALRWAGEFLNDMASSSTVSEELRKEAKRILRHYPSTQEIHRTAQYALVKTGIARPWLAPKGAEKG